MTDSNSYNIFIPAILNYFMIDLLLSNQRPCGYSNLLGLVASLSRGIVRVFDVEMGTCAVRRFDEDVQIPVPVNQYFIFNHSSLLQILQLLERHFFVVQFEHSLRFFRVWSQSPQH
jgi:hypothetical protein